MACCEQTKEDKERQAKWRAEDDLRTITEAGSIRKDKARMKAVVKLAKEKLSSLDGTINDGKK